MKALILVDIQNDFMPGGALPAAGGFDILPAINLLVDQPFDLQVATKDWHPADHSSFEGLWPVHCVQGSHGAEFAPGWKSGKIGKIFCKGLEKEIDSYSGFFDNERRAKTEMEEFLQQRGVRSVFIAGLDTDYCVKYTALDALSLGFQSYVVVDGCRGANVHPEDSLKALQEMEKKWGYLALFQGFVENMVDCVNRYKNPMCAFILFFLCFFRLSGEEVTEQKISLNGTEITYVAITGTLDLKDKSDVVKASIFYVYYMRTDVENLGKRPIAFSFNGGPGAASIWMHMGLLGPKRVALAPAQFTPPPYSFIDNTYTLLDATDLVFIDPVSTGYSRVAPGQDPKQFHCVEEDADSIAAFIRLFTTHFNRWGSPKFLIGASYGSLRATLIASRLHSDHYLYLNGIAFISSLLDFQTFEKSDDGNDLPFILYLPSYTAIAWYYKKLPPELQKDFAQAVEQSQAYATQEYSVALLKGDRLTPTERKATIEKLSFFTGISPEFIDKCNLRIPLHGFRKELLRKENRILGRFDARLTGVPLRNHTDQCEYDPSIDAIFGAFTAAFNQYVRENLHWKSDEEYRVLADIYPWNYSKTANRYLNVAPTLKEVMSRNPSLRIFSANGLFDLATPFGASQYTFNRLNLDPSLPPIPIKYYPAGHMMYTDIPSLIQLSQDLHSFIKNSLTERSSK